mgnify:CR=1 FL=1
MRFDVLTIFPELFESFARTSIVGRAVSRGIVQIQTHDLRAYSTTKHRTVDDYPFGGGAGMVMCPEPYGKIFVCSSLCSWYNAMPVVLKPTSTSTVPSSR